MSITSVIRYSIAKDTAETDGSGKSGLAFSDITAKYLVMGGTLTSLTTETITTLGTYQAPTSAAHIRIKELSSANPTKGAYEIHLHNTQVASSGTKLWLYLSAVGASFQPLELDLTDISGRLPASLGAQGNIKADVRDYNGTAGTFSGGRPEVNATHAAGTAWNSGAITSSTVAADAITSTGLATSAVQEIRNAITGGAYALDTDANGRVRIVDGTGSGEINTNSGGIAVVDLVTDITTKTGYRLSATGVDDIWDEAQSGHSTAGTFGKYLDSAISGVSTGGVSASTIASAVWTDLLASSDFTTTGSVGKLVKDDIDATISSRSSHTAADVWAAVTRTLSGTIQTLDALDTSLKADNDVTQAAIAALNNLSAAQTLALFETALGTTVRSLPGQITPSTTPTLVQAIMQLFQSETNPKFQNDTEQRILNRAGSVVHQKRAVTVVADTSVSLGALVTGP